MQGGGSASWSWSADLRGWPSETGGSQSPHPAPTSCSPQHLHGEEEEKGKAQHMHTSTHWIHALCHSGAQPHIHVVLCRFSLQYMYMCVLL